MRLVLTLTRYAPDGQTKHLPGRHDQSTHGRGWNGGRGRRRDARGRFGTGGTRKINAEAFSEATYSHINVAGNTADQEPDRPGAPHVVGLTKLQSDGVFAYTAELVANEVNAKLRNGETPKGKIAYGTWDDKRNGAELVDVLDEAIQAGTFTSDVKVWRGLVLTDEQAAKFTPGATVRDEGYMSTSLSEQTAQEFAETRAQGRGDAKPYRMRLLVKAGSHGIPGSRYLSEVVLPRGTNIHIVSAEDDVITGVIDE